MSRHEKDDPPPPGKLSPPSISHRNQLSAPSNSSGFENSHRSHSIEREQSLRLSPNFIIAQRRSISSTIPPVIGNNPGAPPKGMAKWTQMALKLIDELEIRGTSTQDVFKSAGSDSSQQVEIEKFIRNSSEGRHCRNCNRQKHVTAHLCSKKHGKHKINELA